MRAFADHLSKGEQVLARGKWRTISTIDPTGPDGVHFRTDVGTDDEKHFLTTRKTIWWVNDEETVDADA